MKKWQELLKEHRETIEQIKLLDAEATALQREARQLYDRADMLAAQYPDRAAELEERAYALEDQIEERAHGIDDLGAGLEIELQSAYADCPVKSQAARGMSRFYREAGL